MSPRHLLALEWSAVPVALAYAAVALWAPDRLPASLAILLVAGLVAWIVAQDLKTFTIADGAVAALAILAIATRWSAARLTGDASAGTALAIALDGALPGGLLLLFREVYYRRRGFDGLGFGDVKLAAAGGLLVGGIGFSWALFAASAAGLGFVATRRLMTRGLAPAPAHGIATPPASPERLAFGAVLGPALWLVFIAQQTSVLPPLGGG